MKVSVLLSVYNESADIKLAVQSVLDQSYKNFELIIIDDQSTDDTLAKVSSFEDSRIKIFRNPNKGKVNAFNLAYERSVGELLVLFAGDDFMPHDSLSKRVFAFEQRESVASHVIQCGHLKTVSRETRLDGLVIPRHKFGNFTGGVIMFNRDFGERAFPIPTSLPNEDTWLEITAKFTDVQILKSPGIVLHYQIHDKNSSGGRYGFSRARSAFFERMNAFEVFYDRVGSTSSMQVSASLQRYITAIRLFEAGDFIRGFLCFGVPLSFKLRLLLHSSANLFFIRQKLFRFLVGRLR